MTDTPKSGSRGRRFTIGGEEPTPESAPTRPREVQEALRLTNPEGVELAEDKLIYPPDRMAAFVKGHITLGELEGITKQEQYKMAERGYGLLESGKLEDAKAVFEGLLVLDPYDAYFHLVRGSIRQREGELEGAEAAYSRSIEVNPFNASAFANRGEVRVLQGQLVEGAEDLIKATELDPEGEQPATQRARTTLAALQAKIAELQAAGGLESEEDAPNSAAGTPSADKPKPAQKRAARGRAAPRRRR